MKLIDVLARKIFYFFVVVILLFIAFNFFARFLLIFQIAVTVIYSKTEKLNAKTSQ